jgi:hypothetical protein
MYTCMLGLHIVLHDVNNTMNEHTSQYTNEPVECTLHNPMDVVDKMRCHTYIRAVLLCAKSSCSRVPVW